MALTGDADEEEMAEDLEDVLHARALVWLRTHLRGQRYHAAAGRVNPDDPVAEAATDGRLLAMEHVGAISPEEVGVWRERLGEAAAWREPMLDPVPTATHERALAHLEALAAPVGPTTREAATGCFSAIAAYEKTGVLQPTEALAWRERLRAQMDLEPERPPRCTRRELLRVIPGPPERRHGLRITSVELYADGVVLQWHHARRWEDGPETPRIWSDIDIETAGAEELAPRSLMDDVGTRYIGSTGPDLGVNGGGWVVRFGTSAFTPAVPPEARRLHNGGIAIDLVTP